MTFENPLQNFLLWGALILGGNALYQGIRWGVKAWRSRANRVGPAEYHHGYHNGDRPGPPPPSDE